MRKTLKLKALEGKIWLSRKDGGKGTNRNVKVENMTLQNGRLALPATDCVITTDPAWVVGLCSWPARGIYPDKDQSCKGLKSSCPAILEGD